MTSFIGMVGDDSAGQHLLAVLDEEGVDTRGVATVGALTGRALISVADDGENHIVVVPAPTQRSAWPTSTGTMPG